MKYKFEWTSEMSVGEQKIDEQHQKLLAQVNKIIEAIYSGQELSFVTEEIRFLDSYINDHFTYEENYMKKIRFPEIEHHLQHHREFAEQYNIYKASLEAGINSESILLEIEKYIGLWWTDHIGHEDKKYFLFAQSQK